MEFYLIFDTDHETSWRINPSKLSSNGFYTNLTSLPYEFHLQKIFKAFVYSPKLGKIKFKICVNTQEITDNQVLLSYYSDNEYAKSAIASYFLEEKSSYTLEQLQQMYYEPMARVPAKNKSIAGFIPKVTLKVFTYPVRFLSSFLFQRG